MSKPDQYAVIGYSDTLRRELFDRVRVITIKPGFTATNMVKFTSDLSVGGRNGELKSPTEFDEEMEILRINLLDRFILALLQTPDKVADMIVSSVLSSNGPAHVVADVYLLKRILWFVCTWQWGLDAMIKWYWPRKYRDSLKNK
jgi:NAD(P)-dependent dehydrogenase (short-subunit alcohol dehydrogenase family)